MKSLIKIIRLPISVAEAWAFFSDPRNLARITPESMNFRITCELPATMYPGLIITYKVSPILGIPLSWVTEITQVKEKEYFIDNQLTGPYKFWNHQHFFKEIPGGVEMTDILHYAAPFGPLGRISEVFFIRKKVREIFEYRETAMRQLFPGKIA
jgi:ligand-binding SRPBCC domain-containing protein